MIKKIKEMDILSKIIMVLTIISFLVILLNVYKIYRRKVRISTYNIILLGDNPMTIYQEDKYVESGFIAKNYQKKESNSLVKITSNVNTNVIGNYKVIYEISNFFKKNRVIREVNVIENPLEDVNFTLKGSEELEIERTNKYEELGYSVISDKGDFTKNVTIKKDLNTNKVGKYEIKYILKIGNKEKSIKRIVNVTGDKYTYTLDNTKWTNQNVKIKIESYLKDFDYFINPNGVKITKEKFNFEVDKNGIYEFHLVDKYGIDDLIKVEVNNIDKLEPSGTCNSFISQNKTTYNLSVRDVSGIDKYIHNNVEYEFNTFVVNKIEDTGIVSVSDTAGNIANIDCVVEYEYIAPLGNKKLFEYNSDTLKYWIEKFDNYTTTHIWVKDAYNQLKVGIPPKRGSLYTGRAIMNNEIKNNGYEEKGMVAINASGIVGGGFGKQYLGLKPSWVGTTAIPLVINNGEIIRDSTNQKTPSVYFITYGMKKDGYLGYYKYGADSDIEHNIEIKNKIIQDGIKNTFAFYPILVLNNTTVDTRNNHDIRQGICQIDRNNFVIVTNTTLVRNNGFGFKDLANYMVKLNCKIGFNLDGGGSVNHYYKANNQTVYTIKVSTRGLVDILYFVEK